RASLYAEQVGLIVRIEEALRALVPAHRGHDVAEERPAPGERTLDAGRAGLAMQRGDQPRDPIAQLVLARSGLQRGGGVDLPGEDVEAHEEGGVAVELRLIPHRAG